MDAFTKHFITEEHIRLAFPPSNTPSDQDINHILYNILISIDEILSRYPFTPTGAHIVIGYLLCGGAQKFIQELEENFGGINDRIIEYSNNLWQYVDCHAYLTKEDMAQLLLISQLNQYESDDEYY